MLTLIQTGATEFVNTSTIRSIRLEQTAGGGYATVIRTAETLPIILSPDASYDDAVERFFDVVERLGCVICCEEPNPYLFQKRTALSEKPVSGGQDNV